MKRKCKHCNECLEWFKVIQGTQFYYCLFCQRVYKLCVGSILEECGVVQDYMEL